MPMLIHDDLRRAPRIRTVMEFLRKVTGEALRPSRR